MESKKALGAGKEFFILLCLLSIIFGAVSYYILPEKFFFDARLIVEDPFKERSFFGGSFPLTMSVYHYSGLSFLPYSIVAVIQLAIVFYCLNKIALPKDFNVFKIRNLFIYVSFFLCAIFIGQPSKEFISFLLMMVIVGVLQDEKTSFERKIIYIALLLFASSVFRPYLLIIPFLLVSMLFFSRLKIRENKPVWILIFCFSLLLVLSVVFKVIKGDYLSEYARERINDLRVNDLYANTIIVSPLRPTSFFGEVVSIFYGNFSVNFPINALRFYYKPQIIFFVLWQIVLFVIFFQRLRQYLVDIKKYKVELVVALLLLSFFALQGVFEPDLGSAIRHKIGIFPLIYYMIYDESICKRRNSK